jgi:CO/xanthine dehydrogenase FAD-binding subunit
MAPLSDNRCDSDYRRDVVRVLVSRALHRHFDLDPGRAA